MDNNYFYHMTVNKFPTMIYVRPDKIMSPKAPLNVDPRKKKTTMHICITLLETHQQTQYYVRIRGSGRQHINGLFIIQNILYQPFCNNYKNKNTCKPNWSIYCGDIILNYVLQ